MVRIDTEHQYWTRRDDLWWQMRPEPRIVRSLDEAELLDLIASGQAVDIVIAELLRRWDGVECKRSFGGGWQMLLLDRSTGDWHEIEGDTLGDVLSTALEVRR